MNCNKAKKLSIIPTLKSMGSYPIKESEKDAWYLSPLRTENKPSFKVCKQKNVWYDFGLGRGGNFLDLVVELKGSVRKALSFLDNEIEYFSFDQQTILPPIKVSKTKIIDVIDIQHFDLVSYLEKRKISIEIAKQLCKEVHFSINGKKQHSIGIQNNSGGWDLRNENFQNASSPKDNTYIKNSHSKLIITEGMFDMMSLMTIYPNLVLKADLLVLNSTGMAKRATKYFKKYSAIGLFLDRDDTGLRTTEYFLGVSKKCIDRSVLYEIYKDPNDWLLNKAKYPSE